MQGWTDRTLSTREWRALALGGLGFLIVGIGVGILIGRLTAVPFDPPSASAPILPEQVGLPDGNPALGSVPEMPAAPVSATPAPVPVVPPPPPTLVVGALPPASPPPVQRLVAPPPEPAAEPPTAVGNPKPSPAAHLPLKSQPAVRPKPVEPALPVAGPRWIVQLGAFQSSDHANLLVNTLAAHGQAARVMVAKNAAGEDWFYVQTPPYRSAGAAKDAARALAAREHVPTYLIRLPAAAG
ncbi:MAG TPA: SPOR domain-containing protein [Aliidongia sp.]|uniref:SPOR domain-containing protein n=1 Tax=Aliidongia sp. TaxID=1914230 RepID=UPI002DDD881E|nr:SPOR domain-containing protein [Aliidongia sp.]HEV2677755.1 SPOR domain-containing protein [Aliidongia sp.]